MAVMNKILKIIVPLVVLKKIYKSKKSAAYQPLSEIEKDHKEDIKDDM